MRDFRTKPGGWDRDAGITDGAALHPGRDVLSWGGNPFFRKIPRRQVLLVTLRHVLCWPRKEVKAMSKYTTGLPERTVFASFSIPMPTKRLDLRISALKKPNESFFKTIVKGQNNELLANCDNSLFGYIIHFN